MVSVKYVTFIIDSIYLYIQFAFHFKRSPKQKQGKKELRIKCLLSGYINAYRQVKNSSKCRPFWISIRSFSARPSKQIIS